MQRITESHRTERVFIISIRNDIDKGLEFPQPVPLELKLTDILEDNVDEKYYLSEKGTNCLIHALERPHKPTFLNDKEVASTIDTKIGDNTQRGRYLIDKSINEPKKLEIANCITAREDRGISHRKAEGTAVVEVQETTKQVYAEANQG